MIYVDIDGVLTDTVATFNKLLGTKIASLSRYDFKDLDKSTQDKIFDLFANRADEYALGCVPNLKLINELNSRKIKFKIMTARDPICKDSTYKWLCQYIDNPDVVYKKEKHHAMDFNDILIDDCPLNVYNCVKRKKTAFLYVAKDAYFESEIAKNWLYPFIFCDGDFETLEQHQ